MNKYQIGNSLRGWFTFDADTDQEAWDIGRAIFNSHFESSSDKGRIVVMQVRRTHTVIVIGANDMKMGLDEANDWDTVCFGLSGFSWPDSLGVSRA